MRFVRRTPITRCKPALKILYIIHPTSVMRLKKHSGVWLSPTSSRLLSPCHQLKLPRQFFGPNVWVWLLRGPVMRWCGYMQQCCPWSISILCSYLILAIVFIVNNYNGHNIYFEAVHNRKTKYQFTDIIAATASLMKYVCYERP